MTGRYEGRMIPSNINKVVIGDAVLYHADCLDVLPTLDEINCIVTDPPYPNQKGAVADYEQCKIEWLNEFDCRQLIFWPNNQDFPLDYTAVHIWDKCRGVQSSYERIFERNGGKLFKVFRYLSINSALAARYTGDDYYGHPSQKPLKLMLDLISHCSESGDVILDPFMGSAATGSAALRKKRRFIGIEKVDEYFQKMAIVRIKKEANQMKMNFTGGE